MKQERILFVDIGSHYGGVETYLKGLGAMLSPYAEGYAVLSLPELASQLRAQGMTVICLPILGSKWFKGLRLLLACFVIPYMLLGSGSARCKSMDFSNRCFWDPFACSATRRYSRCISHLKRTYIRGFGIQSASFRGSSPSTLCVSPRKWFVYRRRSANSHVVFCRRKK